ncbi:MAG: hypothetical protein PHI55_04730 [Burkholderiaceae bacterium]|nr:hypothetical protein [Burkholderiaceae bacterium]
MRWLFGVGLLLALGGLVVCGPSQPWVQHGLERVHPSLPRWLHSASGAVAEPVLSLKAAGAALSLPTASPAGAVPPSPVRKCRQGGAWLYTDGPCPPGAVEQAMERGAVMVLPPAPAEKSPPRVPPRAPLPFSSP